MIKHLLIFLMFACSSSIFGQYEEFNFETDSSNVELVRNSLYRIWEETYKWKDSVFYSVRYIQDTTKLHIEGWRRKDGQRLGKWSEFKPDGIWLYTIDYATYTWEYNHAEYPFQAKLDTIKHRADMLLIEKFGQDFFEKNLVFSFHGHLSIGKWKVYDTGPYWSQEKYLGGWTDPVSQLPNTFILDYSIKLTEQEYYHGMLRLEFDSTGNLLVQPSIFETRFEDIKSTPKSAFTISKERAIALCKLNPIKNSTSEKYEAVLRFGKRKRDKLAGEFYYEVFQQYDEIKSGDCRPNCTVTRYFNVWRFDPWNSELFFAKPMKQVTQWSRGCGVTGDFLELTD